MALSLSKNRWNWASFLRFGLLFLIAGTTSCHQKPGVPQVVQAIPSQPTESPITVTETIQEKSCKDFVQGFYDWYFDRLNSEDSSPKEAPTSEHDVLSRKPAVLSPKLLRMLKEDSDAQVHSDDIVGLDFDPYINAQDWNGKYRVRRVEAKDMTCRAVLFGDDAGTQVEMVEPELQNINGTWTFVNFHYPHDGDRDGFDLISQLKTLQEDRRKDKAKAAHK